MSTDPTPAATIMIVDDSPANLKLLGGLFREHGHKVRPFSKASLALRAAQQEAPDLFLLDINMPELDGYELCKLIKDNEALRPIPVIFLSTLQDLQDKVRAFEKGAVDYVTKQPFHFEEILARVNTHLRLRHLQSALESKNNELTANYQQLKRLEEMKESLTHMIVHDMRSPLTVILMALQSLNRPDAGLPSGELTNVEFAQNAATNLVDMTTTLLDIGRLESGKMPLDLSDQEMGLLARSCLDSLSILLKRFDVGLEKTGDLYVVRCDRSIITRVINNLLGNAAKFTPPGGEITLSLTQEENFIRTTIKDSGPGIAPSEQALVFDKFGQGSSGKKEQGTGLGLTFCRLAIEAHGGKIGLTCAPGSGASFWFTLPRS